MSEQKIPLQNTTEVKIYHQALGMFFLLEKYFYIEAAIVGAAETEQLQ